MFGTLNAATRQVRAVPPLLDAPGHRGGLHPGRARQLHDLQDLLAHREGDRRRPRVRGPKARRAIARFVSLHPTNLAQKAEIIVEHFSGTPAAKIGGRAKAMVVTSSRLHAVRYKQAIDSYIAKAGYSGIADPCRVLGTVDRRQAAPLHRAADERFPESETARRFGGLGYQVLVVAEKFQTGFDQPLLHTIYVDKVLTGLNAVQTLSRLNRIHPERRHLRAGLPQRDRRHREGLRALLRPHSCTTY